MILIIHQPDRHGIIIIKSQVKNTQPEKYTEQKSLNLILSHLKTNFESETKVKYY